MNVLRLLNTLLLAGILTALILIFLRMPAKFPEPPFEVVGHRLGDGPFGTVVPIRVEIER